MIQVVLQSFNNKYYDYDTNYNYWIRNLNNDNVIYWSSFSGNHLNDWFQFKNYENSNSNYETVLVII